METVEDYVRARWNDLVRTQVALGVDRDEAERTARDTLLRCWSDWADEQRSGDVDVLVYGELLRLHRTRDPGTAESDVARVLGGGAGLTAHQVEDLTGETGTTHLPWRREDWDDLYAAPAPLPALLESVRRARRRRRVAAAGVLAAALVVTLVVLRPTSDTLDLPVPDPPEVRNAIPLAWWGDDVLHLGAVEVPAVGLRVLAQAGADPTYAVVYGDSSGQVIQVEADGSSALVGTAEPDEPIIGDESGQVVWIDETAGDPSLVLWDATTSSTVSSLDLDGTGVGAAARLIAFAEDTAYLRASDGGVETWRAGGSDTTPAGDDEPLAVAPVTPEAVSPDGALTASWDVGGPGIALGSVRGSLPPPLDLPGTAVLSAQFVDDRTLVVVVQRTYILGRDYDDGVTQSGRFPVADLVTCTLSLGTCEIAQRRVQDVDPGATRSAIMLPG